MGVRARGLDIKVGAKQFLRRLQSEVRAAQWVRHLRDCPETVYLDYSR
jgi:hypothetical protein